MDTMNIPQKNKQIILIRIHRIIGVLDEIQPIIKGFMESKNGVESGGRENFMAFAILERIYYNAMGSLPLAEELIYNHNIAVPLSQIFRAIIYEIIIGYWLFDSNFYLKATMLNGDFIKKNNSRLRKQPHTEAEMQHIFRGWMNIAPNNFELLKPPNGDSELRIKNSVTSVNFTTICEELTEKYNDVISLSLSYSVLSQQAHISEFSREIIYNKYYGNIKLFDSVCHSVISACVIFIKKIGDSSESLCALELLLDKYYPQK